MGQIEETDRGRDRDTEMKRHKDRADNKNPEQGWDAQLVYNNNVNYLECFFQLAPLPKDVYDPVSFFLDQKIFVCSGEGSNGKDLNDVFKG